MRVGIISDVHGNLPALEKALTVLRARGVSAVVSAGDVIGYGPFPNECIDLLRAETAVGVLGNHELFVLGRANPNLYSRRALRSLQWTQAQLGTAQLRWIAEMTPIAELGSITIAHGSLESPHEYVLRPHQVARQFELLGNRGAGTTLILGHTHYPFCKIEGRRLPLTPLGRRRLPAGRRALINPGSVGQSRQWEFWPRARFAILDTVRGEVSWFAEPYENEKARSAVEQSDLPSSALHLRPSWLGATRRWVKTLTDRRSPHPRFRRRPR